METKLLQKPKIRRNKKNLTPLGPEVPLAAIQKLWLHLLSEHKQICILRQTPAIEQFIALRDVLLYLLTIEAGLKSEQLAQLSWQDFSTKSSMSHQSEFHHKLEHNRPILKQSYGYISLSKIAEKFYYHYMGCVQILKRSKNHDGPDNFFYSRKQGSKLRNGITKRGIENIFSLRSKEIKAKVTPRDLRKACIYHLIHENKKHPTLEAIFKLPLINTARRYFHNAPSNIIQIFFLESFHHEVYIIQEEEKERALLEAKSPTNYFQ